MSENPNYTELDTEADTLGFLLTIEHLKLQNGSQDVSTTKNNMHKLIIEFANKQYDRGIEAGIGLQKLAGND